MTMVAKVSVITVVYNAVDLIENTLTSVINQNYNHTEYIVIDGGSNDVINKYKKSIDIFISEKDNGIFDAMNKGIKAATGTWLNFMNAGTFVKNTVLTDVFSEDFSNVAVLYGNKSKFVDIGYHFAYSGV